jgi:parvulin-like peptidyl-prolyl isomerase
LQPPTEGAAELGDPFMLQAYYPDRSEAEIAKLFGTEFARNVASQQPGQWQGPVLSGYGVHWVYVDHRIEAETPEFEQVREKVTIDWQDQRRRDFDEEFYASLRARYEVVIEDAEQETTEAAEAVEAVEAAGEEFATRREEAR